MIRVLALVVVSLLALVLGGWVLARALSWRAERRRVRAIRDAQREAESRDSLRLSRERAGLELEAAERSAIMADAVQGLRCGAPTATVTLSGVGVDLGAKDSEGTLYVRVVDTGEVFVQRDDGTWEPAGEGCPGTFRAFSDEVSQAPLPVSLREIVGPEVLDQLGRKPSPEPQPISIDRPTTFNWGAGTRTVVETRVYPHDVRDMPR